MSVDITDHRRYVAGKLAESVKKAESEIAKKDALLSQAESESANTGNPLFDKLLRTVQDSLNKSEEHATNIAIKGIGCVQDDMLKLQQFEYFYTKGKSDAYREIALIPARIIAEAKSTFVE